jgi:phosphatidate cytidylyltransferase
MGTRIIAGLTGLAILLPLIIFGGFYAIFGLAVIALIIAQDEYASMALPEAKAMARTILIPGGVAVFSTAIFAPAPALIPVLTLLWMLATVLPMLRTEDVTQAAQQAIRLGFGLVYVPLLLAPLLWLRREPDGLTLLFLVLAVTWLGDTGAYFAGRFAGKTPLFPRVSPKKTREGVVGGVLLAVVGALLVKVIGDQLLPWGPEQPIMLGWMSLIVLGVGLDLAGVLGDLVESMLKRAFGVKDSGWIMPGHGGILDRVDSLLFSGPLLWAVLQARVLLP